MTAQLDLFKENSEIELLSQELTLVKERCENVRKGLFARHNEICKMFMKQQEEIDRLKHELYGHKESTETFCLKNE